MTQPAGRACELHHISPYIDLKEGLRSRDVAVSNTSSGAFDYRCAFRCWPRQARTSGTKLFGLSTVGGTSRDWLCGPLRPDAGSVAERRRSPDVTHHALAGVDAGDAGPPYVLGVPALRSWEIAVTSCAGANGLVSRILFGTPLEAQSSALSPVM